MIKNIKALHLFIFFLCISIIPYCYLSFFTNPSADDFGLSAQSQSNNFFHLIKQTYLYWNGRYVSNIFIYLNPISFGSFLSYKFIPITIIVLFIFSSYLFIRRLLYFISNSKQLLITLLFSLIFIHNMPIISEGIYWYTGAVIYQLGIIITLIYLSFLISSIRKIKKWHSVIFISFLLFIVCGFNEVLTLLMVFILGVLAFIFHNKKLEGAKIIDLQFLLVFIFASIMIFSPGNEIRGESYQNAHDFSHSFIYSVLQTVRFFLEWISSIPLIGASLLYYSFNIKMRERNTLFAASFYLNRWVSLLFLFSIIFICVFPAYWATGILGQHRTLNIAYFFFIILWFINLTAWFNHHKKIGKSLLKPKIKLSISIIMLAGIYFTNNSLNALTDIFSGAAKNYDVQLNERFKMLKSTNKKKGETILIPFLKVKPKSLFVSDISEYPTYWTNQGYNLYFGLSGKDIIISKPTQE